jgi:hypothetical protein
MTGKRKRENNNKRQLPSTTMDVEEENCISDYFAPGTQRGGRHAKE